MRRVAIIGTGTIGSGWAALFGAHGLDVTIFDQSRSRMEACQRQAEAVAAFLELHSMAPVGAARPLRTGRSALAAAAEADLVIEAVPEEYTTKRAVLRGLDRGCPPEVVIASSSSGLSISRLQQGLSQPGRTLVVHPLNPPYLMPLVELVPGKQTDPQAVETVRHLLGGLGKTCVTLKQEVPGFIVNRVAAAVWREVIDLAARGVADIAEIDKAVAAGPCLGWSVQGPFLTYQMGAAGGLSEFLKHLTPAFESWWADMASWERLNKEVAENLVQQVDAAYGERATEEWAHDRDQKLLAVLAALGHRRRDSLD